jgi:hypothetical protein
MNAPLRTPLGKASPRDLRDYKPRLSFNWRCANCKAEWVGGVMKWRTSDGKAQGL